MTPNGEKSAHLDILSLPFDNLSQTQCRRYNRRQKKTKEFDKTVPKVCPVVRGAWRPSDRNRVTKLARRLSRPALRRLHRRLAAARRARHRRPRALRERIFKSRRRPRRRPAGRPTDRQRLLRHGRGAVQVLASP